MVRHKDLFELLGKLYIFGKEVQIIQKLYLMQLPAYRQKMNCVDINKRKERENRMFPHQTFNFTVKKS